MRTWIPALLLAALAGAQSSQSAQRAQSVQPEQSLRLELSGTTRAVGGSVEHCGFSRDGRYLVTIGRLNDLVLWDAEPMRVLAQQQMSSGLPVKAYVDPDAAALFVETMRFPPDGDPGVRFDRYDFGDGTLRQTRIEKLPALEGLQAVVPRKTAPSMIRCRSGSASFAKTGVVTRSVDGERVEWNLEPHTTLWLDCIWMSPRGKVLVRDVNGQLFVLDEKGAEPRTVGGHDAAVAGLCWSPDGRYLAVQSMSGLRIVDLRGRVVHERFGTFSVAPGEHGPEFTLLSVHAIERWNAAVARRIGDVIRLQGGTPGLSSGTLDSWSVEEAVPTFSSMELTQVADGWLLDEGRIGGVHVEGVHVSRDGRLTARPRGIVPNEYDDVHCGEVIPFGDDGTMLASYFATPMPCGNGVPRGALFGSLRLLRKDGAQLHHVGLRSSVRWLRRIPGTSRVLVGTSNYAVTEFDTDLQQQNTYSFRRELRWLECLDGRHAIAGDERRSWRIEIATGKRNAIELPEGVVSPRISAMGAAGHIAFARGADVWIVALR